MWNPWRTSPWFPRQARALRSLCFVPNSGVFSYDQLPDRSVGDKRQPPDRHPADKIECRVKDQIYKFRITRKKQNISKQAAHGVGASNFLDFIFRPFGQQIE